MMQSGVCSGENKFPSSSKSEIVKESFAIVTQVTQRVFQWSPVNRTLRIESFYFAAPGPASSAGVERVFLPAGKMHDDLQP